jgi:hypothetical protein
MVFSGPESGRLCTARESFVIDAHDRKYRDTVGEVLIVGIVVSMPDAVE